MGHARKSQVFYESFRKRGLATSGRANRPRRAAPRHEQHPPPGQAPEPNAPPPPSPAARQAGWSRSLVWLPIPLLLSTMAGLWVADLRSSYESTFLLLVLNFVCSMLASCLIAYLVGRSFLARPAPGLLLLGCGVIAWGGAGLVGVATGILGAAGGQLDINLFVTVHNLCVWLSALCHLAGAVFLLRPKRELRAAGLWLTAGYTLAVGGVGLVTLSGVARWTPIFFVQGQGGTLVRFFVLGSAVAMFVLSAVLLGGAEPQAAVPVRLLVHACLGPDCGRAVRHYDRVNPRQPAELDGPGGAIPQWPVYAYGGAEGGAGDGGGEDFAGASRRRLARERAAGGPAAADGAGVGAALRAGDGGGGGGVWPSRGADGVGRPRIACLPHVLPGGDGGGVDGGVRAGVGGHGIDGPCGGILDSAAGRAVRHRLAGGPAGAGDFRGHGPVHERGRRTLPSLPAQGRGLRARAGVAREPGSFAPAGGADRSRPRGGHCARDGARGARARRQARCPEAPDD